MSLLFEILGVLVSGGFVAAGGLIVYRRYVRGLQTFGAFGERSEVVLAGILVLAGLFGIFVGVPTYYPNVAVGEVPQSIVLNKGAGRADPEVEQANSTADQSSPEKGRRENGLQTAVELLKGQIERLESDLERERVNLSSVRREAAHSQDRLADERARAEEIAERNEQLARQLAAADAERRAAESQVLAAWLAADRAALDDKQREDYDRLTREILALNEQLSHITIRATHWPRIAGRDAVATFELYLEDFAADKARPRGVGLFEFAPQSYDFAGDHAGRLAEALGGNAGEVICLVIAEPLAGRVPLRQAIEGLPELADYDAEATLLAILAEFQYLRTRVQLLGADSLFAVRGYADGEEGHWELPLDPRDRSVVLHENSDPTAVSDDYALAFNPDLTAEVQGRPAAYDSYGSEDLPNLRAAAVAEILSAIIVACPLQSRRKIGSVAAEVLEGHADDGRPADRRVRVNLLVFLDEQR